MYYGIGFTHTDVYDMPIYLRRFYYKELLNAKKAENETVKKARQKQKSKSPINPRFKR